MLPLLQAIWPWWVTIGLLALLQAVYRRRRLRRSVQHGIEEIDRMNGQEFEEYLEALFTHLGYRVERTRYVGDYGADLIVYKDRVRQVIQAKRYKGKVGPKAIGDALRARGNYHCSAAMVVTNSRFTRQAIEEARANGVTLWDREQLVQALKTAASGSWLVIGQSRGR